MQNADFQVQMNAARKELGAMHPDMAAAGR
jgi:hypothetical protein